MTSRRVSSERESVQGVTASPAADDAASRARPQAPEWSLSSLLRRLNDPGDTTAACAVAAAVMLFEALLCTVILLKVPYTKIDWDAYMSQVEGFLGGERDYTQLRGDTGPLVYPAGFLYTFTGLRWATGGQVPRAQVIFLFLYLLNQLMVLSLYIRARVVPPWSLFLLSLSKRVHSIFLLRLFNDCVAMALVHASLLLMQSARWAPAMVLFSAAVSVKMNVLLFAPPLLLLLTKACTLWGVMGSLFCAAAVQVGLGLPFLSTFPREYLKQAFDLGRVFIHHWSVNFKFVPEDIFVSKQFAITLLSLHLGLLCVFANLRWARKDGGVLGVVLSCFRRTFSRQPDGRTQSRLPPSYVLSTLMVGNFIGIVCARSLHYQFYCWYLHSLPLLLWLTPFPTWMRLVLFATTEVCWNIFPSTAVSSLVLLATNLTVLFGLSTGKVVASSRPVEHLKGE